MKMTIDSFPTLQLE